MKVIRFYREESTLKLKVDSMEDLWTLQRIILPNDIVRAKSVRRFRPTEQDEGEMKEVMITLRVEKVEVDRGAAMLRLIGKILDASPLEYVKLNSYHTLSVVAHDVVEITKPKWHNYLRKVISDAVEASKRPRLGLMLIDDEKALPAYLFGYGIEFMNEVYSKLSNRMKPKDFTEAKEKYYGKVVAMMQDMNSDVILVAGPGFEKDNLKKYIEDKGLDKTITKRIHYTSVSNTERSGVYELIRGEKVANLLSRERLKEEFRLMDAFLNGLNIGKAHYGLENVGKAMKNYEIKTILVTDSVLSEAPIQELLNKAESSGIEIEIFNAEDEVGKQLRMFKDIAAV